MSHDQGTRSRPYGSPGSPRRVERLVHLIYERVDRSEGVLAALDRLVDAALEFLNEAGLLPEYDEWQLHGGNEGFHTKVWDVKDVTSTSLDLHYVSVDGEMLVCRAMGAAEEASYRVRVAEDRVWVELVMADRWLSESIEADLMHTGDKLEELLEDELVDLGESDPSVSFEHFRSDDMLFTFRTPIDVSQRAQAEISEQVLSMLIAYEACFRNLGDMSEDSGEAD